MKKTNLALREILYRVYELNEPFMSQKSLAEACDLSPETVSRLAKKLNHFKAIKKKPQGFRVINPKKILEYWSATRNLHEDIAWSTYTAYSIDELEEEIPSNAIFTAYSGYQRKFGETPVPYETVYVYASEQKVKKRFSEPKAVERDLIILETDPHLKKLSENQIVPRAQLYADLWQIGTNTADRYRLKLREKLEPEPLEALKSLTKKSR